MFGLSIQVIVILSSMVNVENGPSQGSVISPILFNIMINYIFDGISQDINKALYADDGVLWKRGRNVTYVVKNIQKVIER